LQQQRKQKGDTNMELVTLFYLVDEFCKAFEPEWQRHLLASGEARRIKPSSLSLSEVLTILIHFHQSNHKTFKGYYTDYVSVYLCADFPGLVSYSRFVELMSEATVPLHALLVQLLGVPTLANFIDSTKVVVCDNHRIPRNKVFRGIAARGKSSMGWFYGFKLHLVVNERGEITSFMLTPGNVADNNVRLGAKLCERLYGKLYGDRGYISRDLFETLWSQGTQLVTGIKKNMKNRLLLLWDKLMLRKRNLIETINDQLKNSNQIEHTRHRSPKNFLVNLLAGLIAYQLQPKKPRLHFTKTEQRLLTEPLLLPA
jgi:hypothetical protein